MVCSSPTQPQTRVRLLAFHCLPLYRAGPLACRKTTQGRVILHMGMQKFPVTQVCGMQSLCMFGTVSLTKSWSSG